MGHTIFWPSAWNAVIVEWASICHVILFHMQSVCKELKGFASSLISCLYTMGNLGITIVIEASCTMEARKMLYMLLSKYFYVHAREKSFKTLCFDPLI
jgi:hypothetical protein